MIRKKDFKHFYGSREQFDALREKQREARRIEEEATKQPTPEHAEAKGGRK
jgi:hypothetical protein